MSWLNSVRMCSPRTVCRRSGGGAGGRSLDRLLHVDNTSCCRPAVRPTKIALTTTPDVMQKGVQRVSKSSDQSDDLAREFERLLNGQVIKQELQLDDALGLDTPTVPSGAVLGQCVNRLLGRPGAAAGGTVCEQKSRSLRALPQAEFGSHRVERQVSGAAVHSRCRPEPDLDRRRLGTRFRLGAATG